MGRRSAAGAGAAAQAEASVTMSKEEPKRKRSAIYVRKTLVKPQSPKEKDTSKLPPSPPPMSKARVKNPPPKATMSPPRIRDGRVVSPSPMSKPRLNNHYMPPKYHSPPRSRMRGVSPPPPVGIRGRVARGLSPNMSSPSPPPYEEEIPQVLPPSPVLTTKIRRQVSPSRLPPRSRRHASPTRSPSPTPRGRGGRRTSPPRPPISPSPRSRSRVGRASSPPRLPPSPATRGAARRRSPSPHLSPPTLPKTSLTRKDPAIREITPCLLEEPIHSPIYERLSPLNTNKRCRSPSPSYLQGHLSSKPPLPPQALSSRRPRSPTPVEQRILGPLPTKRSTSPRFKRRFSCVTVLPQDPIFGDLKPTLPPPPPTAPSNFRRITPNFASRRSRKASFVILNETTVKRKMGSRRASVDGTEVDGEGKVKVGPRSMSEEGPAKEGEEGKTKEESGEKKGKGKNGNGKNGNGKNGSKKPVYIVLPDEEQPSAEGDDKNSDGKNGKENGNGKKTDKTKEGKEASGDTPGTSAAVASSEVLAAAGGVAVGTPVPGGSTTVAAVGESSGEAKADGKTPSGEQTAEASAVAAVTTTAGPAAPGAVSAATQGDEAAKAGTPTQEEMMSKVVKGEVDVESMDPNQMPPSMQDGAGGIRDQKQILEPGALSSRGSIASTMASGMKDDIVSLQMGSGEEGVSGSIHGAPSDEAGSVDAFPGSGKESSSKEGSVRRQCSSEAAEVTDQEVEDNTDLEEGIAPYIVIDVSSPVHKERMATDSSPTPSPPPSPIPTIVEVQDTSDIDSEEIGVISHPMTVVKYEPSDTSDGEGSSGLDYHHKVLILKKIEEINMRIDILRMEMEKTKILKLLEEEKLKLELKILKKRLYRE